MASGKKQFSVGKDMGKTDTHLIWGLSVLRKNPETKPLGVLILRGCIIVKAHWFGNNYFTVKLHFIWS